MVPSGNKPFPELSVDAYLCRHIALLARNELSNGHNVNGDLTEFGLFLW